MAFPEIPPPSVPEPTPSAGRSLLIVEGNQPVAQVLAATLEDRYKPIFIAGSLEEIRRLTLGGHTPAFDVVLCDHGLPDASSQEVRRWLDEHRPPGQRRAAFVLMAGSLPGFRRVERAGLALLPKPFTIDDLHGAIAEAEEAVGHGEGSQPGG